jgi:hypothetical protein
MDKKEAIKAALDGKKFCRKGHPSEVYSYGAVITLGITQMLRNGKYVGLSDISDDYDYELYVEAPKPATRAEAWAALLEGKTIVLQHAASPRSLDQHVRLHGPVLQFRNYRDGEACCDWQPSATAFSVADIVTAYFILPDAE